MNKISLTVTDRTKLPFLLQLLRELHFVELDPDLPIPDTEMQDDVGAYLRAKVEPDAEMVPMEEAFSRALRFSHYRVEFRSKALQQLDHLPQDVVPRLKAAVVSLAYDPRPAGSVKLVGQDAYRVRRGEYRIIYELEGDILRVLVVDGPSAQAPASA